MEFKKLSGRKDIVLTEAEFRIELHNSSKDTYAVSLIQTRGPTIGFSDTKKQF